MVLREGFGLQEAQSYVAFHQKQLMVALTEHEAGKEHFTAAASEMWKEASNKRERLRMYVFFVLTLARVPRGEFMYKHVPLF